MDLHFNIQETSLAEIYSQLLLDDVDDDGILDSTRQEAFVSLRGETTDGMQFLGSGGTYGDERGQSIFRMERRKVAPNNRSQRESVPMIIQDYTLATAILSPTRHMRCQPTNCMQSKDALSPGIPRHPGIQASARHPIKQMELCSLRPVRRENSR
jgi:hypothetical protein